MGGYELVHNVYFWNAIIAFGAIWGILNCICFYWNMELYCQFMKWHLFDAWSFSGYICYPSWGNQISKYYNYSWNMLFYMNKWKPFWIWGQKHSTRRLTNCIFVWFPNTGVWLLYCEWKKKCLSAARQRLQDGRLSPWEKTRSTAWNIKKKGLSPYKYTD